MKDFTPHAAELKAPTVTVRVPGKVMLAGEYSVLRGGEALTATLDLYMKVTLSALPPRLDAGPEVCAVSSTLWDEPRFLPLTAEPHGEVTEPLLCAVARGVELYQPGALAVHVDSALDVAYGVGSSSALRLGVLIGTQELARCRRGEPAAARETPAWEAARAAYTLQLEAQTVASGYDTAAQLLGGVTLYSAPKATALTGSTGEWPGSVTRLEGAPLRLQNCVRVFVGGRGAPTGAVLRATALSLDQAQATAALDAANCRLVAAWRACLQAPMLADLENTSGQLSELAVATAAQRRIMATAPAFPHALAEQLTPLPGCDAVWSFKTTGAGGEDALLIVGDLAAARAAGCEAALAACGWTPLTAAFTDAGTTVFANATARMLPEQNRRPHA